IVAVAAGREGVTSFALRDDGAVLAWGGNASGQIGDGTQVERRAAVRALVGNIGAVAAGESHGLAVATDGQVWTWGVNALGDGSVSPPRPTPAALPVPTSVVAAGSGGSHAIAITSDGQVWTWGLNAYSQLGDGTTTNRYTPVQIAEPGFTWKAAGPSFSP